MSKYILRYKPLAPSIELEIGMKVKTSNGGLAEIVSIRDLPWGFPIEVRFLKTNVLYEKGEVTEYRKEHLEPIGSLSIFKREEEELNYKKYTEIARVSDAALNYAEEGQIDESRLQFFSEETDPEGWMKEKYGQIIIYGTQSNPADPFVKIKGPCGHYH